MIIISCKVLHYQRDSYHQNFLQTVTDYKVVVPNDVPVTITIKPTSVETTSTIKVNETLVTKDGAVVEIPVGRVGYYYRGNS